MPKSRVRKPKSAARPAAPSRPESRWPRRTPAVALCAEVTLRDWAPDEHDVVGLFIAEYLRPQLHDADVPEALVDDAADDVARRLTALLAVWNEPEVRDPVLLPTIEEATFYEPAAAPLLTRALVVAAVRNSFLEELHATHGVLADEQLAPLTAGAVGFLAGADLEAAAALGDPTAGDHLRELGQRYPMGWAALTVLAWLEARGTRGEVDPAFPEFESVGLDVLGELEGAEVEEREVRRPGAQSFGYQASGMADGVPAALREFLAGSDLPTVSTVGFGRISRNLEVLLRLLEYLMTNGGMFVSANYALGAPGLVGPGEPGVATRRAKLVCMPFSRDLNAGRVTVDDLPTSGMTRTHRLLYFGH